MKNFYLQAPELPTNDYGMTQAEMREAPYPGFCAGRGREQRGCRAGFCTVIQIQDAPETSVSRVHGEGLDLCFPQCGFFLSDVLKSKWRNRTLDNIESHI